MTNTQARGFPGDDDYVEGDDYPPDARDYGEADSLLGPNAPAASFPEIGTTVEGVVVDVATGAVRDLDTGENEKWGDGSPKRQVILTLQTRDKLDDDDDGRRRLFVKGGMVRPFREALGKARVQGPRVGAYVVVTYYDDGTPTKRGMNPPKLYSIAYTPTPAQR